MTPTDPYGNPLPYPGDPGFPPMGPPDTGGPTSANVGSENDVIREAIRLLNLFLQLSQDDVKIARVQKIIASLSDLLAKDRQLKDKVSGIRPEDRATGELMAGLGLGGAA